jgi:hypothetical protein
MTAAMLLTALAAAVAVVVELLESMAIVLAVGTARRMPDAVLGALAAVVVLAVVAVAVGPVLLGAVPLGGLEAVIRRTKTKGRTPSRQRTTTSSASASVCARFFRFATGADWDLYMGIVTPARMRHRGHSRAEIEWPRSRIERPQRGQFRYGIFKPSV